MPVNEGLARLSDTMLVSAIGIFSVAMLLYAVEYAFGRAGWVGAAAHVSAPAIERVLAGAGAPAVASTPLPRAESPEDSGVAGAPARPTRFGRVAVALTVLGWVMLAATLVFRGLAVGRVPWGNMYEFAIAVCFIAVSVWLVLLARQPVRHLGAFVLMPTVLLLGLAGTVLYTPAAPLVPALNSYWLKIHVTAAVGATGIFLVGFATSALYLLRHRYEHLSGAGSPVRFPTAVGARLPESESLERLTFRIIAFGFPIWTFAVIAGAIWAEAAWGRYWGWDPKETWAFIAWVIYATYLHARATAGWQGRRAVLLAVAGWAAMMFNLFAVNMVIAGLHSYAGLN